MSKYVILPGCDDGNRGDQALVWETIKLAKQAGFDGEYFMLCPPENMANSKNENIKRLSPVLEHPGRKASGIDNTKYGFKLMLNWGLVAVKDYIASKLILWRFTRKLFLKRFSDEVQKTVNTFLECDACFVKGGGFLHSYGSLVEIYQMYFFLYHISLATALGKKVYIMPNSYGPFKAPTVKRQIKKALKKCELVLSRESISQKMLEEIGVSNLLYPDLAFGLEKRENDCMKELKISCDKEKRKMVGITVRPYRFPDSENPNEQYKKYIDAFSNMAKWLYDNNFMPIFVEHVYSNGKNESDIQAITDTVQNLDAGHYAVISNHDFDCRDMKYIYSNMDYVIGTRFHSVIFTLSEIVPCVAVAYGGNKGVGIMKDLSLDDYLIKIEDVSFDKLKDSFEKMVENSQSYKEIMAAHMNEIKEKYNELSDLMKN